MRKKTVKCVADTIFWYGLYFLPVLGYLLFLLAEPSTGTSVMSFSAWIDSADFFSGGVVYDVLDSIFATGDYGFQLPDGIIVFFSWFVSVYLMHLAIDFLLFIPRIAHKWLNCFTRGEE